MIKQNKTPFIVLIKPYIFSLLLLSSVLLGGLTGYFFPKNAGQLKPFGELFLNLILTAIVPLIFFSIASAIAKAGSLGKLGRISFTMFYVFLFTGIVAAIYAIIVVKVFPPGQGVELNLLKPKSLATINLSSQLVSIFTVSNFSDLLSHEHLPALIVFSILAGLAAAKEQKHAVTGFLQAGEVIFMRVFALIMYYAPIGFFAYFAFLVSELGPKLMENYARVGLVYYLSAILYFLVVYSVYAYLAGKIKGLKLFWKQIFLPMITAIATCSSAASIPANLVACKNMNISAENYETVIPLGTLIHKEGSIIGGIFKIAFLFGIFHLDFAGLSILVTAVGVSLLVGTVMGAIPSGGMLGELLILSVYGFPPSVLIAIAAISIIIDPIATMLNVTGNTISAALIDRLTKDK